MKCSTLLLYMRAFPLAACSDKSGIRSFSDCETNLRITFLPFLTAICLFCYPCVSLLLLHSSLSLPPSSLLSLSLPLSLSLSQFAGTVRPTATSRDALATGAKSRCILSLRMAEKDTMTASPLTVGRRSLLFAGSGMLLTGAASPAPAAQVDLAVAEKIKKGVKELARGGFESTFAPVAYSVSPGLCPFITLPSSTFD